MTADIDDWLGTRPARYRDGKDGFDIRLARDLAEAGTYAYTVDEIIETTDGVIAVVVDWLNNVETRIDAQSGHHFRATRGCLISALLAPEARRKRDVIDALFNQILNANPPLGLSLESTALQALDKAATRQDFDRMVALLDAGLETSNVSWIIHYLGQFKNNPEAQRIVRSYIDSDDPYINMEVVTALGRFGDPADLPTIERFADHDSRNVQMAVRSARRKLQKKAAGA